MSFVTVADIINRALGVHSDTVNFGEAFGMFGWRYGRELHNVVREITDTWPRLESPIEAALFPYLVMQDYGPAFKPARPRLTMEVPAVGEVFVAPQYEVQPYRLDFAVTATKRNTDGSEQTVIVAVECDGRSFHEAVRDTKRDVALYRRGIITVRATGAEIFQEPADVALRVARLFREWGQ